MRMNEPVRSDNDTPPTSPHFTLLGQLLVLGFLVFMVMGLIKLGLIWFG